MGFVLAAFFAAAVVVAALWIYFLQKSASADRTQTERQAAWKAERARQAQEEAKLHRKGIHLHCLGCGAEFSGPLPDDGCPQCHVAALVVTQADYLKTQKKLN